MCFMEFRVLGVHLNLHVVIINEQISLHNICICKQSTVSKHANVHAGI